jgi:hypothetical protein
LRPCVLRFSTDLCITSSRRSYGPLQTSL